MSNRPLLPFILTIALLFAAALSASAVASAATMNHDMQMTQMGHCSSMPSKNDRKAPVKSCCIAMCTAAVAVVPAALAELPAIQQPAATFPILTCYIGFLGEIATPPPRLS